MELKGKTVLITGAAKRVGRTIALTLARQGAHVLIHYGQSQKEAQELAGAIADLGVPSALFQADLSNTSECLNLIEEVSRDHSVDVLINNASIFPRTPLGQMTDEDWDRNMAVNLKAPFTFGLHFGQQMKKKGRGKVINIIDWSAYRPYKNYLPYCVSKGGLVTLTQALALELAPEVQVNGVAPGPVLPPEEYSQKEKEQLKHVTPLQKLGTPEDVAKTVQFLIEGSDFITGQVTFVDGGRMIASGGTEYV
jgi:pteridine reductase